MRLCDLPDSISEGVLSHLGVHDLLHASRACSRLHALIRGSDAVWSRLHAREFDGAPLSRKRGAECPSRGDDVGPSARAQTRRRQECGTGDAAGALFELEPHGSPGHYGVRHESKRAKTAAGMTVLPRGYASTLAHPPGGARCTQDLPPHTDAHAHGWCASAQSFRRAWLQAESEARREMAARRLRALSAVQTLGARVESLQRAQRAERAEWHRILSMAEELRRARCSVPFGGDGRGLMLGMVSVVQCTGMGHLACAHIRAWQ